MTGSARCIKQADAEKLLKDAEGLVQLSNLQLRLAVELRNQAEHLAKPKKKPKGKPPAKKSKKRPPS